MTDNDKKSEEILAQYHEATEILRKCVERKQCNSDTREQIDQLSSLLIDLNRKIVKP